MNDWRNRTECLVGESGIRILENSKVMIVGAGGVGGYCAEALVRAGVGHLVLIDGDDVDVTNINRQIIAGVSTVGKSKVELFAERFRNINPHLEFEGINRYISPEDVSALIEKFGCDFVVDAIDTVSPKCSLIIECKRRSVPIVSSMGAGGRRDASKVRICDIWDTRDDGLAKAVRTRLKRAGIKSGLPVVWSQEIPSGINIHTEDMAYKRTSPGSICHVPATFGLFMASFVINKLLGK